MNTCHVISNPLQLLPRFNVDNLEIANCPNLSIVCYFWGDVGQELFTRSCYEDVILTKKSHNCAGTAFVQGDSAGGSKLIEQTLRAAVILVYQEMVHVVFLDLNFANYKLYLQSRFGIETLSNTLQ